MEKEKKSPSPVTMFTSCPVVWVQNSSQPDNGDKVSPKLIPCSDVAGDIGPAGDPGTAGAPFEPAVVLEPITGGIRSNP